VSQPLRAFLRLSRPVFLAGGFVGVGLGSAVAAYVTRRPPDWGAFFTALAAVAALQLMTHFSNDYFDREADVRTIRTAFSGGSGVLVEGALAPRVALGAAQICLALGLAGVALFVAQGRTAAAILTTAIAFLAWFYSAPPLRLLARGLGELNTALIVAVLVPLLAYVAQGAPLGALALAATLPGGAALFVMMLCVEVPDIASDAAGRKRNLLVRFGRSAVVPFGCGALGAVYLGIALAILAGAPPTLALLEVLTLPLAYGLAWAFKDAAANTAGDAALAARGVAFSFLVGFNGLLGYLVPLHWRI
jgi:1,4-dihydroxy-2-naphthoate octaprenyltransferase